jgi:hypothetical protein
LSPFIIESIVSGNVSPNLTVSGLARTLPHRWSEQEHKLGCSLTSRAVPLSRPPHLPRVKSRAGALAGLGGGQVEPSFS